MQGIRSVTNSNMRILDLLRSSKLRAKDLRYFNSDYESENNEFIVSVNRYIYYRDIFM